MERAGKFCNPNGVQAGLKPKKTKAGEHFQPLLAGILGHPPPPAVQGFEAGLGSQAGLNQAAPASLGAGWDL